MVMGGFFFILLLLHLAIQTGWGDDAAFAQDTRTLGQYLSERYNEWTSRLIVEAGIMILLAVPDWIWRLLNILMVLLLVWIVADLFGMKKEGTTLQAQVFFFVMLVFVPIDSVCEVGWVVTTLNYLWPLTLGFVAMRPARHWFAGETCPHWEYLVCPLCLVCGANTEQGALILLGVYLLTGVYLIWRKRKLPFFYIVMVLLLGASVAFIMSTPGNAHRYVVETQKWFPEYAGLNLIEKFLVGFIDTMNYYFSAGGEQVNYVMAPLTGILLIGILQKRGQKGFWLKLFPAFLPFAFYWGVGLLGNWWLLNKGFARGGHIVGLFGMNRCLPVGAGVFDFLGWIPYSWGMVFLQAGVYLILLVCVALTIFFLHGSSTETLLELTVLGIGLMSRFGMGFSPTVYASGARTALYSTMAVLIVCLRNLQIYCDSALKGTQ